MKIVLNFRKNALKFLRKNKHILSLQMVQHLTVTAFKEIHEANSAKTIDVELLKGTKNIWRIRTGKIRIIFSIDKNERLTVLLIQTIDWRGNVYT